MTIQNKHFLIITVLSFLVFSVYPDTYQMKKGDTLYSIAGRYSVTVDQLMDANGVTNPSSLKIGMVLTIPGTGSVSTGSYKVEKGDTYYSISRRFSMSVSELLTLNNLTTSDVLSIGKELRVASSAVSIPNPPKQTEPEPTPEPVPSQSETQPRPSNGEPHIVKTGGTRQIMTPQWPVSGTLFAVEGDFKGFLVESTPSTYVQAITSGSVVWAGPYWGFGEVVLIDYNDSYYFYGGNSDIFVNVGQEVTPGTRLGRLENNNGKGNLYFTIYKEGKVVDLAKAVN